MSGLKRTRKTEIESKELEQQSSGMYGWVRVNRGGWEWEDDAFVRELSQGIGTEWEK